MNTNQYGARLLPRALSICGAAIALVIVASPGRAADANASTELPSTPLDPWAAKNIVEPSELAKVLAGPKSDRPTIVCVGFPFLYRGSHIIGAVFAGPTAKPEGIAALKHAAEPLSREAQIVLYCGCCPWKDCPNIRPAFRTLREMGFRNVRVLSIPTNLHQDWVAKGYPAEPSPAAR